MTNVNYNMAKVFDLNRPRAPQEVFDAACLLNNEAYGGGNDSYLPFSLVENPTGDEEGLGYISDEEIQAIQAWLISGGAVVGENVLIKCWW